MKQKQTSLHDARTFLSTGQYPPVLDKKQKKALWKYAKKLQLEALDRDRDPDRESSRHPAEGAIWEEQRAAPDPEEASQPRFFLRGLGAKQCPLFRQGRTPFTWGGGPSCEATISSGTKAETEASGTATLPPSGQVAASQGIPSQPSQSLTQTLAHLAEEVFTNAPRERSGSTPSLTSSTSVAMTLFKRRASLKSIFDPLPCMGKTRGPLEVLLDTALEDMGIPLDAQELDTITTTRRAQTLIKDFVILDIRTLGKDKACADWRIAELQDVKME
ncbi:UNVERIFIED_CONTAM: hypothetical protein FKN15_019759 [Acipenser sinensis]